MCFQAKVGAGILPKQIKEQHILPKTVFSRLVPLYF